MAKMFVSHTDLDVYRKSQTCEEVLRMLVAVISESDKWLIK